MPMLVPPMSSTCGPAGTIIPVFLVEDWTNIAPSIKPRIPQNVADGVRYRHSFLNVGQSRLLQLEQLAKSNYEGIEGWCSDHFHLLLHIAFLDVNHLLWALPLKTGGQSSNGGVKASNTLSHNCHTHLVPARIMLRFMFIASLRSLPRNANNLASLHLHLKSWFSNFVLGIS